MLNFKKIKGNFIHKTAVINWKKINIGKGNIIGPYVVIGNSAQWPKKKSFGLIILVTTTHLMNFAIFIYQHH